MRAPEPFPFTVNLILQMGELTFEGVSYLSRHTKGRTWTLAHICQGTLSPLPCTPGGLPDQQSYFWSELDSMLMKRLGYRWAMLFQSTSSSRKPWSGSNRHMALPSCRAAGCESTWGPCLPPRWRGPVHSQRGH